MSWSRYPPLLILVFFEIYIRNDFNDMSNLWYNLINISKNYKGYWFIEGDFNEVLQANNLEETLLITR